MTKPDNWAKNYLLMICSYGWTVSLIGNKSGIPSEAVHRSLKDYMIDVELWAVAFWGCNKWRTQGRETTLPCSFPFISKGPSRLGEPGPRLQQMMDSGKLNASSAGESMALNASIRERLRSKVRGRQVK